MCNVCDADYALGQTARGLQARFQKLLLVEATGRGAEEAAKYRFRREQDADTDWTEWLDTDDLSLELSYLGTDTVYGKVPAELRAYLEGGPVEPVLKGIQKSQAARQSVRAAQTRRGRLSFRRSRKRTIWRNKKFILLFPYLPAWKPNKRSQTFRVDGWLIKVFSLNLYSSHSRFDPLQVYTQVTGPLKFRAKLKDVIEILKLRGVRVGTE